MPSQLLMAALSAWSKVPVVLSQEWFDLGPVPLESILLFIERERKSGLLELVDSRRSAQVAFQHGFITRVTERERRSAGWTQAGLMVALFGWRSGKVRFVPHSDVEVDPGFPLRPGQLLTLAWLLCMDRHDRFVKKRKLFDDFVRSNSRRASDVLLFQILTARLERKSGELEIAGEETRMTLTFVEGEVAGVNREIPTDVLDDLCLRYGYIPSDRIEEVRAESERSRKKIVAVALERKYVTGLTLELLHALADWEVISESFQWEGLRSGWVEPGVFQAEEPPPRPIEEEGAASSSPIRCGSCGEWIAEGEEGCPRCAEISRRREVSRAKVRVSRRIDWAPAGKLALILLLAAGAIWWAASRKPGPPPPARSERVVPAASQKTLPPAELTLTTASGETRKLLTTEIRRFSYEASRDTIAIRTVKETIELPFSEIDKFDTNIQRQLEALRKAKKPS